jgi:hypothetical protein
MHYRCLILACLAGIALANPIPPRASPVIGVVIPSDVPLVDPMYEMGDSVERPAPEDNAAATPVSYAANTTLTSTTPSATTTPVELRQGCRFLGSGNVVTTPSPIAAPLAAMGDAVQHKKPSV